MALVVFTISRAARRVKVTSMISPAGTPLAIRWATRYVITRVLPEPGPARIRLYPSGAVAAAAATQSSPGRQKLTLNQIIQENLRIIFRMQPPQQRSKISTLSATSKAILYQELGELPAADWGTHQRDHFEMAKKSGKRPTIMVSATAASRPTFPLQQSATLPAKITRPFGPKDFRILMCTQKPGAGRCSSISALRSSSPSAGPGSRPPLLRFPDQANTLR